MMKDKQKDTIIQILLQVMFLVCIITSFIRIFKLKEDISFEQKIKRQMSELQKESKIFLPSQ